MKRDLNSGSIWGNIIYFSLPFLLSYFLQTFYGLADLFIVGQYNGADIISAVSVGSQVMHMLTVVIVGLAMGSTVMIGRAVGAGNTKEEARAIGNTMTLFMALSLLLTAVLLLSVKSIVSLMMTPAEAVEETRTYLMICFVGIPFITVYNVLSSVLRGRGDARSPMLFVVISCTLNIILDIVFIGFMDMRAAGAALGTVISQTVSVFFALIFLAKKKTFSALNARDMMPQGKMLSALLKIGVPIACQDAFIQISFIVITVIANTRGVEIAASVGIVEKIIGILFLVPSAMLSTVSALAAQNIGGNLHKRARTTMLCGITVTVAFGSICAVACQFISPWLVGIFSDVPSVVEYGSQYLRSYVLDCVVAGIHFCFGGWFCAYGYSMVSFLHNMAAIFLIRIPGAYIAAELFPDNLFPMGLASPIGSLFSAIVCVMIYIFIRKKQKRSRPLEMH